MEMEAPSYYSILGVTADSSDDQIRRAYRKLAMKWHPDKWSRTPSLLKEAHSKFQQIQEAYSVLSDKRKRMMYDAGLYDPDEDDDEDFADFLQEMVCLMDNVKKEEKQYSLEELQGMFVEMAQGFESHQSSGFHSQSACDPPQWLYGDLMFDGGGSADRACSNTSGSGAAFEFPGFEMYRMDQFCR